MARLVIAGNYNQYKDWLRTIQADPRDYMHISDNTSWRGFHNVPVIKVGTWRERTDIDIREIEFCVNSPTNPKEVSDE